MGKVKAHPALKAAFFLEIAIALSPQQLNRAREISRLEGGARLLALDSPGGKGLAIVDTGSASVEQGKPVQLEFYAGPAEVQNKAAGYESLIISNRKATGVAHVAGPGTSHFYFVDEWSVSGSVLDFSRTVRVSGESSGGFLSSITFSHPEKHSRAEVDYFAPGMIYGGTRHLSEASIGGRLTYEGEGHVQLHIREDRLPAPMFGVRFRDGSALTILDPSPSGETTRADSHDTKVESMVDERFHFGAIGVDLDDGHHSQGYWFPGTEGEVTYRGDAYPGGQAHEWRRRYQPIRDGLVQKYRLQFRFSKTASFPLYLKDAWRWAYAMLQPEVSWHDIPALQRNIVDVLASQVQVREDRAGIPNAVSAVEQSGRSANHQAIMGFTGKNLEAAELLLADAGIASDKQRAATERKLGLAIFASFVRLRMNPPLGEGFNLETGEPALAIPRDHCVFLRSFGDDMKATLRAYLRERKAGFDHKDWLAWTQSFGDWLLTQQTAGGGFPRSWKSLTGEVADASLQSSYNPIPFLVLLAQETGDLRYLQAAVKAGDFAWSQGQSDGSFVGGTIDNPDILDKEAATLSIEAYLSLFQATRDAKWLARAAAAADYAETWIYIWNVPMPKDEDNRLLHWKAGVSTCGTQLIATGHSLVDDYMSFDVDEYAKLGHWAPDAHYLGIAKLLLHNTKNMVASTGRPFDLRGPGWQQEHFSFAPVRGVGLHRMWLPWVATSQLEGIFGLMDFDRALFQDWTSGNALR